VIENPLYEGCARRRNKTSCNSWRRDCASWEEALFFELNDCLNWIEHLRFIMCMGLTINSAYAIRCDCETDERGHGFMHRANRYSNSVH